MLLSSPIVICFALSAWAKDLSWAPHYITECNPTCWEVEPTITRTVLVVLRPTTATSSSTRTITATTTLDKKLDTVEVISTSIRTTGITTTRKVTSITKTVSETTTSTVTSTIPAALGFHPAADTIDKYPAKFKRTLNGIVDDNDGCSCNNEFKDELKDDREASSQCLEAVNLKPTRTKEILKTYTPTPHTVVLRYTKTITSQSAPSTASTTTNVTTIISSTKWFTETTTVTTESTKTSTQIKSTSFYAACAANNIIMSGPRGGSIVNIYNRGKRAATVYDKAHGTFNTPYDCCVACQQNNFCTGWIARTGQTYCLLLRNDDRTCAAQSAASAFYVVSSDSHAAGFLVGNGPCGYQYYGGSASRAL